MGSMKKHSMTQKLGLIATFLVMGVFVSACDSNEAEDDEFETTEVQDLFTAVSSELELSSDQETRFRKTLRVYDHADREPGYLWIVADSLTDTLDDDQIDALLNRTDSIEGFHPFKGLRGSPGGGGYYGFGGIRGAMGGHGESESDDVLNLTEEQEDAIRAIYTSSRDEVKGLRDRHETGELSDEEFITALMDLHESTKEAIDNILTDDQKADLEEFRRQREADFETFREAVRAVRDDVLGLTLAEAIAFNAITADQLNMREVLMEQFESGDLSLAELRNEVDALRAAHIEAIEALLTEPQFEILQIHAALIIRVGMRGHRGRHDGHGGSGGPSAGF